MDENDLVCLNKGEGTRLNYNGTLSHLDLVICSRKIGFDLECDKIHDLWGSDHYPLLVTFKQSLPQIDILKNKYTYKNTNWILFQEILNNDKSLNEPVVDVEGSYNKLISAYIKSRDISVPINKGKNCHKYSPFWNQDCSKAKLNKKIAEKELRKNKNVENQINYKKCKAHFRRILSNAKKIYWGKYCSDLNKQTKLKHVWNQISQIKGKKSKSKIYFKTRNGSEVEDSELANLFADNFRLINSDESISCQIIANRKLTVESYLIQKQPKTTPETTVMEEDSKLINSRFNLIELKAVLD